MNVLRTLSTPAALLLLALALAITGVNYARHTEIIEVHAQAQREKKMQSLQASWVSHENITHTVTTPRLPEEEVSVWILRHKESVEAMKLAFPPVPATPK